MLRPSIEDGDADEEVFAMKTSPQRAEYMPTIQEAVQAAAPGDAIKFPAGAVNVKLPLLITRDRS